MDIVNTYFQMQLSSNNINLNKNSEVLSTQTQSKFDRQYEKVKSKLDNNSEYEQKLKTEEKQKTSSELKKDITSNNKVREKISQENKKSVTVDKKKTEEEIVEEISQKTDKTPEEITQLLEEMGLTVFDLIDVKNLNNFVQKLLDIDSPVEMLVSSEAKEFIETISEVLENFKDTIKEFKEFKTELLKEEVSAEVSETILETEKSPTVENSLPDVENDLVQEEVQTDVNIKTVEKGESNNEDFQENKDNFEQSYNYVSDTQYINNNEQAGGVSIQQQLSEAVRNVSGSTQVRSSGDTAQIINQITEQVKVEVKNDTTEMHMVLNPKSLGELTLKVAAENNIVTAQFIVENQKVKEIIEANFNSLKDTLQQMGLMVEELSVSVQQNNSEAKQHFERNREKSRRRVEQIIAGMEQAETEENENVNPYNLSENQVNYLA